MSRKIIIVGATSGIGRKLADLYLANDCIVGITGRRTTELESFKAENPDRGFYRTMDVCQDTCTDILDELIEEMGGMDLLIYSAGVGTQNPPLDPAIEIGTVGTNVYGFSCIVIHAYNYFKNKQGGGHIANISSLAAIRPLRQSPAYSATKRYQTHYISCLAQKANKEKVPVRFTMILPGFIRTGMLKYNYPFITDLDKGARLIYRAIEKKRRNALIPGSWRILVAVWKLIPGFIWERVW